MTVKNVDIRYYYLLTIRWCFMVLTINTLSINNLTTKLLPLLIFYTSYLNCSNIRTRGNGIQDENHNVWEIGKAATNFQRWSFTSQSSRPPFWSQAPQKMLDRTFIQTFHCLIYDPLFCGELGHPYCNIREQRRIQQGWKLTGTIREWSDKQGVLF